MKKTIIAMVLGLSTMSAMAQTPDEFRSAFQQNFKPNSIQQRVIYGTAEAVIQVVDVAGVKTVVLEKASGNIPFDNEVVRAAKASVKSSLGVNLRLPVTYTGSTDLTGRYNEPRSLYGYAE